MIIFIAPRLGKDEKKKLKTCLQCSKIWAVQDLQPHVHGPFIFSLLSTWKPLCFARRCLLCYGQTILLVVCYAALICLYHFSSFPLEIISLFFFLFHVVSLFIITQCYFPIFDLCTTPLCHKISKTFCTVFVPHVHELYASENVS